MIENHEKESKLAQLLSEKETIDLKLSYSRISDFDRNGPKVLITRTDPSSKGLSFGRLTDDLLVDKVTGSDIFKNNYYIYDGEKPSATLGILCDIILDNYDDIPNQETILNIINNNNFWTRTKDENKIIAEFNKDEFWEYLNVMFKVKDKVIITQTDYEDAQECVRLLLNHKHTNKLFNSLESHYQFPFSFEYKGFILRGIIDKISIDTKNKIVYIEDIKTGSSKASKFMKSFLDYRYDFQEAVYTLAFDEICRLLNLENYTLAPFKFIFIGRYEKVPHVFEVSTKWHEAALNGFKTKSGYNYRGLNENLDLIYYHWKNKVYDFAKEVYEQNGHLILNDDFIEVN